MRKIKWLLLLMLTMSLLISCGEIRQQNIMETPSELGEETIDLYGTYDQNDLLITTLEEEYEGVTVDVPQVEGLKNKEVEKKVNQDIHSRVKAAYKSILNLKYVTFTTSANFSNVLSIGVYMGGEAENSHVQLHLNYNLVNGNPLAFEELFTKEADTLEIIRNAFRQMLITNTMNGNYDENELYKMVKIFSESKEKNFAFSPREIYLYHENYSASVPMKDYAQEITVYSRYATEESLYERDDIGRKDLFTCVDIPENMFNSYEFGYLEDNFWRDFACPDEYIDDNDKDPQLEAYLDFKKDIYKEIDEQIEEYRKMAKQNPDRVYIFLSKPVISRQMESEWVQGDWEEYYTGIAYVERRIQIFEMSKETFEEEYKDILIESYRYEYFALQGGLHLEPIDGVTVREVSDVEYYDYVTGERVTYEQ